MAASDPRFSALDADWLALCRRAAARVGAMLDGLPETADRAVATGRGEGGDEALVIDRGAEDAVFVELEALGAPLTVVSEERGRVELAGGGPVHVVVDPIDGSLNAKRRLPDHCLSIAVARGDTMADVEVAYVRQLGGAGTEWWALRGRGAFRDGERLRPLEPGAPLEILGVESANPRVVARFADALEATGAHRLRVPGAIALTLCLVADARLDAMLSLAPCRSVDAAAGQLVVREAGGAVLFPDAGDDPGSTPLALDMRSRVVAATSPAAAGRLVQTVAVPA